MLHYRCRGCLASVPDRNSPGQANLVSDRQHVCVCVCVYLRKNLNMLNLVKRFANDDHGFVVSSELVLILTIGVIGLIVGLDSVQNAVVEELADIAAAVGSLNQSYTYTGFNVTGTGMGLDLSTKGSSFADYKDANDAAGASGGVSQSIAITIPAAETP